MKKAVLLFFIVFSFMFLQSPIFAKEQNINDFYTNRLKTKLEKNWIISVRNYNKQATAIFTIDNQGKLLCPVVLKSSSDKDFGEKAIITVYKAAPFEKLSGFDVGDVHTFEISFSNDVIAVKSVEKYSKQKNIEDLAYANYLDNMQSKINANWKPKNLRKKRDAIALVNIDKDGTINTIKIQKSGGKKRFDSDVYDAITRSVPFDALPSELKADYKNVQLEFVYDKTKKKYCNSQKHYIIPHIPGQNGYDEYTEQIEEIINRQLAGQKFFCKKDISIKINITKDGKVKYVNIVSPTVKDNFIKKEFNRNTLYALKLLSFPIFPSSLDKEEITLDFRIVTQRGRSFNDFYYYVENFCRTGLYSFYVQGAEDINDL